MSDNRNHLKVEVQAYLDRIGYEGPVDSSIATLSKLQECHLHNVPYENLDILNRKPLSLEITDLIDKIVVRRRGGFCFELNALFGWLLRELGYTVTDLFARFWRDETNVPPKQRHHVLKVEVEGTFYLCDVGVGGIVPRNPIEIIEGVPTEQGNEIYRLDRDESFGWVLCELAHGQWRWIYSFTEEPKLPIDYIMPSFWCENAPDSIFINNPIVAIRTLEGRNTVAGEQFRIFKSDGVQTITPQTKEEYKAALHTHFGIVIE